MPLITINAADVAEYHPEQHGGLAPDEFRLYANRDFIASDGTFVEKGSDSKPTFFQSFGASLIGSKIRIASGDAYSTTDALDDDGLTTYTGVAYADGVKVATLFSSLRIPTELNPVDWSQLVLYSQGRRMKRPSTYLSSSAILGILAGYVTSVVKATSSALGITKLDTEPVDLNNPTAVGTNSALLNFAASDATRGHVFLDEEPADPAVPVAVSINSPRLADGVRADIEIAANGTQHLIVEPQVLAVKEVYKHLSKSYASLTSAVIDALDNPTTLFNIILDETPTLDNLSLPSNLILDYNLGFGLNVNAGQIVFISPPANAPAHRLFWGDGQVRYRRHPGFRYVDAIHYLDDGTGVSDIPILANQSEGMRWGTFLNNGGYILMPLGTKYTIDHDWVIQRGEIRGSASDPNINGTVIKRVAGAPSADQPCLISFMPGGRTMKVSNMVLRTELADCALLLARGISATLSQSVDGIEIDNVTCEGGSEGYRVHNTNGDKNHQVHNVRINENCNFLDQTVACIRVNSVNAGGHYDGNYRPAPGARGFWYEAAGKTEMVGNGIGVAVAQEAIQFSFLPADVSEAANTLSDPELADLESGDKIYLTNTGGALPTGWSANTPYWIHSSGTLHLSPEAAIAGASAINITDTGTGTHHLWSSRALPAAVAVQPEALVVIDGPYSEGIMMSGLHRDEAIPIFLRVTSNTPTQRSVPITVDKSYSHGQIILEANVDLNINDGFLRANSIKDVAGVSARVRVRGTKFFTYGVGGPQSQYGGYGVPSPAKFDDFRGNSVLRYVENDVSGDMHGANANDVPIFGMQVQVPGQTRPITAVWQRDGSGALAGWWRRRNSYLGHLDAQVGVIDEGGYAMRGRLLNFREDTIISSGGVASLDLRLGDIFEWPVTEDATLNISNFTTAFNQKVTIRIFATGTSRTLTFGTGFKTTGTLATGTDATKRFIITFDVDGSVAVEQLRTGAL